MLQRKRGSSTQSYFFSLLKYAAWKSAYFAFSPQFAHNFDIFAERVHTCTHSSSPLQHTQKAHKVAVLCHKLGRGGGCRLFCIQNGPTCRGPQGPTCRGPRVRINFGQGDGWGLWLGGYHGLAPGWCWHPPCPHRGGGQSDREPL